jgi:hypothetical protein
MQGVGLGENLKHLVNIAMNRGSGTIILSSFFSLFILSVLKIRTEKDTKAKERKRKKIRN